MINAGDGGEQDGEIFKALQDKRKLQNRKVHNNLSHQQNQQTKAHESINK